ncbi:MAG: prepilin-type N-terminal cleavage/methylation domain-containing protein [Nitrospirae bacterium]|nr:prepilin-type N-terminal cleavage/methylation domain-containing protein [Nitrospirota bacterium]
MKVQGSKFKVQSYFKKLSTNKKGFTLIELLLIIIIVAIALPTLLWVLGQGARQGVDAELRVIAANLAQGLMEEIKSKRWDENSPIPPGVYSAIGPDGEARTACTGTPSTFDDVDDYNGYSETCPWGGVSYTRDVQVCYVNTADLNACVAGPSDYKRIRVTVSNTTIGSVELVTVVTNY